MLHDKITLDTIDRLARIETTLERLVDTIDNLPASPAILQQFDTQNTRITNLESFEGSINQKLAWIGGVFAAIGVAIGLLGKYIVDHITLR